MRFDHEWFPKNETTTFWEFFFRFNTESDRKEEQCNVRKFMKDYETPMIPRT